MAGPHWALVCACLFLLPDVARFILLGNEQLETLYGISDQLMYVSLAQVPIVTENSE